MGYITVYFKKNKSQKTQIYYTGEDKKVSSTILQLLDMSESELTWVTNHFGHTKDQRNWYRREDATIELTKIAKVLLAVNSDESRNVQSKRIDDLLKEVSGESNNIAATSRMAVSDISGEEKKRKSTKKKTNQLPSIYKISDEQEETEQEESDYKLPKNNQLTRKCSATTRKRKTHIRKPEEGWSDDESSTQIGESKSSVYKKRKTWIAWSEWETKAIERAFCDYILRRVSCPTSEITRIIKKIPCLERRGVPKVRDKLNNIVRKTKGQYG